MSYFDSEANFERLTAELKSWRGTKFLEGCALKGVGADCARFAEKVFTNIGCITPVEFPPYVVKGGGEKMLTVLAMMIQSIPEIDQLWWKPNGAERQPIKRGDLLLCSTGKAIHHLAIAGEPPTVWHAFHSVCEGSLFDPIIGDHIFGIYRVR